MINNTINIIDRVKSY